MNQKYPDLKLSLSGIVGVAWTVNCYIHQQCDLAAVKMLQHKIFKLLTYTSRLIVGEIFPVTPSTSQTNLHIEFCNLEVPQLVLEQFSGGSILGQTALVVPYIAGPVDLSPVDEATNTLTNYLLRRRTKSIQTK